MAVRPLKTWGWLFAALALLLTLALPSTAHADPAQQSDPGTTATETPTGTPSTSETPAATPSGTETPAVTPPAPETPAATPSATETPTASETPSATQAPAVKPDYSKLPATWRANVERYGTRPPVAQQAKSTAQGKQGISPMAGEDIIVAAAEPVPFEVLAFAECVTEGSTSEGTALLVDAGLTDAVTFDWTLTGGDDSETGTVVLDPFEFFNFIEFSGLTGGDYTLTLVPQDPELLPYTYDFSVIECVSVKVACQAVIVTNPADNPAVYAEAVGTVDGELSSPFDLGDEALIQPGETKVLRVYGDSASYLATNITNPEDPLTGFAPAGEGVEIPLPDCDPLTLTQTCAADGETSNVDFAVEKFAGESIYYEIYATDRDDALATGETTADDTLKATFDLDLKAGDYLVAAFVGADETPLAVTEFAVEGCEKPPTVKPTEPTKKPSKKPTQDPSEGPAEGGLADTGAPPLTDQLVFAGLLLAAGTSLVLLGRRRPVAVHHR